jgi:SNF2 family DNA or RNA helicase
MINPLAVKNFLARELDDSTDVKTAGDTYVNEKFSELGLIPRPGDEKIMTHQKAGFILGAHYRQFLLFFDMGLGKTLTSILLMRYFRQIDCRKILVLVPNSCNIYDWNEELRRWSDLDDVTISTYAGFYHKACHKTQVTYRKKTSNKMIPNPAKLAELLAGFDMVVYDEITMLGNPSSLGQRIGQIISANCKYRIGLTGTPFGKNMMELWGIFRVIDNGLTLGQTIGMFREAFFNKVRDYWKGWDYKFKPGMTGELNRMIRHRSLRYEKTECLDLPEKVFGVRHYSISREALPYLKKLWEEARERDEDGEKITKNMFHKLRAVCSGFLPVVYDGKKDYITFASNPKFDSLIELIHECDDKMVIFYEYLRTGEMLRERMKREKIRAVCVDSSIGPAARFAARDSFANDPNVQLFMASSAGAYGLNLQIANYLVLLETPTNPKTRKQEIDRVHRIGQQKTVFVYDFCASHSIEKKILTSLEANEDLFLLVIEGKVRKDELRLDWVPGESGDRLCHQR